ncbi:hypothetical protein ACHAXR_008443 [Thalassiosira sp. AJA248-18]
MTTPGLRRHRFYASTLIFLALTEAFTAPLLSSTRGRGLAYHNFFGSVQPLGTIGISRTAHTLHSKKDSSEDAISDFCQGTNEFWRGLVIEPVRNYVDVQPAESSVTATSDVLTKLTAPPEIPGVPRPVWLTILGSVPTGLIWYGYYKFSVEEELYQYEMQETGKVSGAGGYGTLFPFVYGILIGFPL